MLSRRKKIPWANGMLGWALVFLSLGAMEEGAPAHEEHKATATSIGLEERTGESLPPGLVFLDETGKAVKLDELVHIPTVLTPVYYSCPDVCSLLLYHLTGALHKLAAKPGRDYQVITFSFDETEKPSLAMEKKRFYLKMMDPSFPEGAWRFLTGEPKSIAALTEAIGFRFKREGAIFQHPVATVILSPKGKIIRYLYGTELLPFDIKMGLLEASEGRVGPSVSRVLRFCFSYDPQGRRYVFNTLKVTGIVTLFFAVSLILFLLLKGKKRPSVR